MMIVMFVIALVSACGGAPPQPVTPNAAPAARDADPPPPQTDPLPTLGPLR